MNEMHTPTDPHDLSPVPFAGRQAVYARLHQHIMDPPHRDAIVFTGHDGIGKTTLLTHVRGAMPDSILSLYFPLRELELSSDDAWLRHIIAATNALLTDADFSLSRVPSLDDDPPAGSLRDWMEDDYLPQIFHIIRQHRRLVWLMDDAECLLQLPSDHLIFLHNLLAKFPQLAIVLTINTQYDRQLTQLVPLVNANDAERIHRLSAADSHDLLQQLIPTISETVQHKVYQLTGGHPRLLQRFGDALIETWASDSSDMSDASLQRVLPRVYAASKDEFTAIWRSLSRDERLTLTAIASLLYEDAVTPLTAKRIEDWLIETDYPTDLVAINAALRGLDYRDIVRHQRGASITLLTGLMQTWLLENARLDEGDGSEGFGLRWWMVAAVVVIAVLLAILITQLPDAAPPIEVQPTVTLSS